MYLHFVVVVTDVVDDTIVFVELLHGSWRALTVEKDKPCVSYLRLHRVS